MDFEIVSEQPHFSLLIIWLHWEFIFPIKIQSYHPPMAGEFNLIFKIWLQIQTLWSGFQVLTEAHRSACLAKFPHPLHTYLSHHTHTPTHTRTHTHTWLTKFSPAFASPLQQACSPFPLLFTLSTSSFFFTTLLWTTSKILQSCLRFFRRLSPVPPAWESMEFGVIEPFQVLHLLTTWPQASCLNFQRPFLHLWNRDKDISFSALLKKIKWNSVWKCLAQILQRLCHSFLNPQYKALSLTYYSKFYSILNEKWADTKRDKIHTYKIQSF